MSLGFERGFGEGAPGKDRCEGGGTGCGDGRDGGFGVDTETEVGVMFGTGGGVVGCAGDGFCVGGLRP